MLNQPELIAGPNHALNREVGAFHRCLLQATTTKGAPWEKYAVEVEPFGKERGRPLA